MIHYAIVIMFVIVDKLEKNSLPMPLLLLLPVINKFLGEERVVGLKGTSRWF